MDLIDRLRTCKAGKDPSQWYSPQLVLEAADEIDRLREDAAMNSRAEHCNQERIAELEAENERLQGSVAIVNNLLAAEHAKNERLRAALKTQPILSDEQRHQLGGFGSVLPAEEIYKLGWKSALAHAALEPPASGGQT